MGAILFAVYLVVGSEKRERRMSLSRRKGGRRFSGRTRRKEVDILRLVWWSFGKWGTIVGEGWIKSWGGLDPVGEKENSNNFLCVCPRKFGSGVPGWCRVLWCRAGGFLTSVVSGSFFGGFR